MKPNFPGWIAPFENRTEAGKALARLMAAHVGRNAVILGLPRGGVPVAFEIARALGLPLDVLIVRKLGVPGHEELAMGAIATGGVRVLNDDIVRSLRIPPHVIDAVAEREARVIASREKMWRGDMPPLDLTGKEAVLVDDGIATGASMRVAVGAARAHGASKVIVAAPVAPTGLSRKDLDADTLVLARTPDPFFAVGNFYVDFEQTTDHEVQRLLQIAHAWHPAEM